MSEIMQTSFPSFRPEAVLAGAQNGLACWSRAWTQMAQGLMCAGMAQMELNRSIMAPSPGDWARTLQPGNPRQSARQWLDSTKTRYDAAVSGYRRINDDLASTLFGAAESLVSGIGAEAPSTGTAAPASTTVSITPLRPQAAAAAKQKARGLPEG